MKFVLLVRNTTMVLRLVVGTIVARGQLRRQKSTVNV